MPETRIDYILNASQATTTATKLEQSFQGIGKAAQSAGVSGAAGVTQIEQASVRADPRVAALFSQLQKMKAEIAALPPTATSAASAIGSMAPASTAAAAASAGLAGATAAVGAGSETAKEGLFRLTNMINTGQGPLRGYDALIQALVRSIGGIPIWAAVAIPIVLALAAALMKKGDASAEAIKIDKEQLAASLALADAQQRLIRVQGDLFSSVVGISREAKTYLEHQKDLVQAQTLASSGTGLFTGENVKLGISLQRNHGFLETVKFEMGALVGMIYDASRGQKGLNNDVVASAEALAEQDKKVKPLILAIAEYRDQTGQSSEAVIQWAEKVGHLAPEAVAFLREQLQKLEPFIAKLTEDLQKLTIPKFDMKNTMEGVEAQVQALLSGLTATFEKGIGGSATATNSFRAQVQALGSQIEALDNSLKRVAGTEAAYNKLLSEQLPTVQSAIALHKQLNKEYDESFKTKQKTIKDIGPALEMESLKASIALHKEDFSLRRRLITEEFDLRRAEMVKNRQDTELNLALLRGIQIKALSALEDEHLAHYKKIDAERLKDQNRFFDLLDKQNAEVRKRLIQQRQIREDEEKKFYANQAKIEFAARSDRPGRREEEAATRKRQNDENARAVIIFGQLARSEQLLAEQVRLANGQLSDQEAVLTAVGSAAERFTEDWIKSGAIFQVVADGISNAMRRMVANGEDFGANMKAMFLDLIAQLAEYWGRLFISMGAGMMFINPGAGIGLVAAGMALMALAGVFHGLSDKAQKAAAATGNSAGGAGSSATSGAASAGVAARPGPPTNVIPFPTSPMGQTIVVHNHFDRGATRTAMRGFLEGEGFVTESTLSSSTGRTRVGKQIKKLAKAS